MIFLLRFYIQDLTFHTATFSVYLTQTSLTPFPFSLSLFLLYFQNFIREVPKMSSSSNRRCSIARKSRVAFNDGARSEAHLSRRLILNTLNSLAAEIVAGALSLSRELFHGARRCPVISHLIVKRLTSIGPRRQATPEQRRSRSAQSLNYSGM